MAKNGNDRETIRVMFVCLGNICRSPLAEGVFRKLVREHGLESRFEIRSSGTGDWHVGQQADRRMRATAQKYAVDLSSHCGAQLTYADLERFDHLFVMDKSNLHDVLFLDRSERFANKVRLFREFDPEPDDFQVPDPYYGGVDGFDHVYAIVDRTARVLLHRLVEEYQLTA
ncbi:MAG TPA: low molecular weight protein-tyrosine-phosphatase [Rhodothermales bacterium]